MGLQDISSVSSTQAATAATTTRRRSHVRRRMQNDVSSMETTATNSRPVDAVVQSDFVVAIPLRVKNRLEYATDLRQSMDILAVELAYNESSASSSSWDILIDTPTSIDGVFQTTCPRSVGNEYRCEDITVSIGMWLTRTNTTSTISRKERAQQFTDGLDQAVNEDRKLQHALDAVNSNSTVWIVSGNVPQSDDAWLLPNEAKTSNNKKSLSRISISTGAVAAIVCGILLVLLIILLVGICIVKRQQKKLPGEETYLRVGRSSKAETDEDEETVKSPARTSSGRSSAQHLPSQEGSIASTPPQSPFDFDYDQREKQRPSSPQEIEVWEHPSPHSIRRSIKIEGLEVASPVGSPAKSSNIQSRSPIATLEDPGDDDKEYDGDEEDQSTEREFSQAFLTSEMDASIYSGDWTAVGVTAALLASSSYGETSSQPSNNIANSNDQTTMHDRGSNVGSYSTDELDRLVEMGNWEAVMAVASRLEMELTAANASSDTVSSPTGIALSDSGTTVDYSSGRQTPVSPISDAHSTDDFHATSASVDSSLGRHSDTNSKGMSDATRSVDSSLGRHSDTNSKGMSDATRSVDSSLGRQTFESVASEALSQEQRFQEIWKDIEMLIREVVPEEVDNIGEMMRQFHGKEDELLERLLAMKERFVAQKARLLARKKAQRVARETIKAKVKDYPALTAAVVTPRVESFCGSNSDSSGLGRSDEEYMSPSSETSTSWNAQVRRDDEASAAEAAAEWAIARSLSNMMASENQAGHSQF